jgi:hypothetical protein
MGLKGGNASTTIGLKGGDAAGLKGGLGGWLIQASGNPGLDDILYLRLIKKVGVSRFLRRIIDVLKTVFLHALFQKLLTC